MSEALRRLRSDGLVQTARRQVVVLDMEGLRAKAQS
jgi:Mn-dependent DtxR family transcriptional regulator